MTRHSKNNTTAGSFTYAERQKLSYGSQTARCTKDSLRPLMHCHLCLQEARDANCCPEGHVACRSCFLEDILAQKRSFKEKKAEYEAKIAKQQREIQDSKVRQKETDLIEFISQQQGSSTKRSRTTDYNANDKDLADIISINNNDSPPKEVISCRSGTRGPHPISLKTLLPLIFHKLPGSQVSACPTCLKSFSSISKALAFPNCGHVVCEACYKSFKAFETHKCLICDDVAVGSPAILIESEGTGFAAAGGIVETKRYDLAFQ